MLQNSKTILLINTLNKKSINALLSDKNIIDSQKLLLNCCLKLIKSKSLEKEELFELFYKEKYSPEKDFLIRNDLRKLNETLESFIALEYAKVEIEKDYYTKKRLLCLHLFKTKEYDLLEKELNAVFIKIDENEDYQNYFQFINIWYLYKNQQLKYNLNYLDEILNFIADNFYKWELEVAGKTKLIELYNAYLERVKSQLTGKLDYDREVEKIDLTKSASKTNYLSYLSLKEKSYKSFGKEKIELLKKAIKTLKKIKNNTVNQNAEHFFITQMLGVEYMIHKDYENAQKHLKESISIKKDVNDSLYLRGVFNYISAEIFLKNYNIAIQQYLKNKKNIDASELKENFICTISICGVLDNQINFTESIHTVIPSKLNIKLHLYSRFTESILHFLRDELDLCLNELKNCTQVINYHKLKEVTKIDKDFIKYFKQFLNTQHINLSKKEEKEQLQNLYKNIHKYISADSTKIQSNSSLHLIWLEKTIENKLSQT